MGEIFNINSGVYIFATFQKEINDLNTTFVKTPQIHRYKMFVALHDWSIIRWTVHLRALMYIYLFCFLSNNFKTLDLTSFFRGVKK